MSAQRPPAARLTLVQRHDCGLCEEMRSEIAALARSVALPPLELLDVDSDQLLLRRHGHEVPVLLLDGTVVCRHRFDAFELLRLLRPAPGRPPA